MAIWLQTLVAIDSESCQRLFPSFYDQQSEIAVLFYSILSRHPFLWQVVNLNLLLCTGINSEHADLFLCRIFTQRPRNDQWKLLWSATTSRQFHGKFHFTWKTNVSSHSPKFTFFTIEPSQYHKSGSMFSSSKLACQTCSSCAWAWPRAQPLILSSGKAFGVIARWSAEAWTWTQNWTLQPDQHFSSILASHLTCSRNQNQWIPENFLNFG